MYLVLVLLFWSAVVGGIGYRYRKVKAVEQFLIGYRSIWHFVIHAKMPDIENETDIVECGQVAAAISVIISGIALAGLFAYSIHWALY